jgi:NAD(P)H-flavin reductase
VIRVSDKERLFKVTPSEPALLGYRPGQFFMVGLPGYGEAPISVTSAPGNGKSLELCIRAVGNLTNALHRLGKGNRISIRGPFGTSFPTGEMRGKDMVFVAGGIGIVPMRSLIKTVLKRPRAGRLTLVYGAKSPEEMLFTDEFAAWRGRGLDIRLTIDAPHPQWQGNTGVVTTLLPGLEVRPEKTVAAIIGPPVMYRFVVRALREMKLDDSQMYLSLERRMKCGVGKCGHCQINSSYVCQEGPVYRLDSLKGLSEAL